MPDSSPDALSYHALALALHANYPALARVRQEYKDWQTAWSSLAKEKAGGIDPEAAWRTLERQGIRLILSNDPAYPPGLREIPWPPFGIYVRGTLPGRDTPALAIVGTRKATESSRELARAFAGELARVGVVIVSGLALGVDAASHVGCLDAGGKTVAVLGSGIDRIYPALHERLAQRILDRHGAIVSEYPPGTPTLPYRFLERNRIVSGLGRGVLVIEAPEHSGALATARFALEQNRDVFVVPGPAPHPHFRGSHALIRAGAELVTSTAHILEALHLAPAQAVTKDLSETREEKIILDVLRASATPLSIDKIIELSKLKTPIANQAVSFLAIKNRIQESEGGYALIS